MGGEKSTTTFMFFCIPKGGD